MATIYIESYSDSEQMSLDVTLESLIVLHVFKACDNSENVELKIVMQKKDSTVGPLFQVDFLNNIYNYVKYEDVPPLVTYCTWPVVLVGNKVVAGLASVSRHIIKQATNKDVLELLGFREACLMACNEVSIWTKFCEIDMIGTVKEILNNPGHYIEGRRVCVPENLSRFEVHMEQPVRIHNVYKLARVRNNNKLIKSNIPIKQLNLEHRYGEGPFMTLADLLLFPCFHVIFQILPVCVLSAQFPLTIAWYENLCVDNKLPKISFNILGDYPKLSEDVTVIQTNVIKQSLYTADPKRYKPVNRIYTKQNDIEKALGIAKDLALDESDYPEMYYGHDVRFSWDDIPLEANPLGGSLPESRASRKCQQLENLARATVKICKDNRKSTIVDFCSGSGHLGILVALLLPTSHIILVENKERSLQRAQDRIIKMNLTNISLVQSNLDYFIGSFDIGIALHACGVATDLVLQKCIKNKAQFVCCPCCYGGIHDCHHLTYPRSKVFEDSSLTYRDYLTIGHSADQTHDVDNVKTAQGYICMHVVDMDRKRHAEECGYTVHLRKLFPPSCTPKNNLLVGIL